MQLDSPVPAKVENVPPHEHPGETKGDSGASAYAVAAADAYTPQVRPENAVLRQGDQRSGLITKVQDALPTVLKDDISTVLKDGQADSEKGKWSDQTKGEWKKLVDDLKKAGFEPQDIANLLNHVGSGINDINDSKGVKNLVGMAVESLGNDKYEAYMTINGPNIDKVQNDLDAAFGQESDTVLKAGTFGGRPEQHI